MKDTQVQSAEEAHLSPAGFTSLHQFPTPRGFLKGRGDAIPVTEELPLQGYWERHYAPTILPTYNFSLLSLFIYTTLVSGIFLNATACSETRRFPLVWLGFCFQLRWTGTAHRRLNTNLRSTAYPVWVQHCTISPFLFDSGRTRSGAFSPRQASSRPDWW